ncbi:hypothetical protein SLA2020_234230 [Shorea laevis]
MIWSGFLRDYINWGLHGKGVGLPTPQVKINKQDKGFLHDMHDLLSDVSNMQATNTDINGGISVEPNGTGIEMRDDHGHHS